jgi:fructose-1,6-bisphosphatase/inositol monophosphatase family enzyme
MVEFVKGFYPRDFVAGVHIAQAAGAATSQLDGLPIPGVVGRSDRVRFAVAATPGLLQELLWLVTAPAESS